ncbi:hypothetical protein M569_11525 [Genlisea aurea]|uniref:Uncharacterized protein n=1 Tax=Genlisea aurea TaxID=192259 RepID=S8C8Q6_9LAMI|nr:hypothetical protein M569_11525 [Genlisea aurea]
MTGKKGMKCRGCGKKWVFGLRKSRRRKKWCCWNQRRPEVDSDGASSTSGDPNNSGFSLDALKRVIETNDFYSGDCNPHSEFDD